MICTVQGNRWFIDDAGDHDPEGARLGAMLQTMLARTPHIGAPDIRAWLPHGFVPPQVTRIETWPAADPLMLRPLRDRTLPMPPIEATQVALCRLDYF